MVIWQKELAHADGFCKFSSHIVFFRINSILVTVMKSDTKHHPTVIVVMYL